MVLTFNTLYLQAATPGSSTTKTLAKPVTAGVPIPSEAEFEFSDVTGLMCLLCARQFKTIDQLKRHNKESDLHKARNFNAVYTLISHGLTFPFVLLFLLVHLALALTEKLQRFEPTRHRTAKGGHTESRRTGPAQISGSCI